MLASSGGFVAICPKKEVELGADKLIHRADHAEELRQEIEFPCAKAVTNQYAHLCGGALRAINPNSNMTMAEMDTCAAVFKGNLFNKAELAMQLVGCPPQLNEAQLLLHLYAAKALDMLGMLQGQYAFCLYDSKQARVLAARDHSGAVPLLEGRTAAGSLIIACGTFLPEGVYQMVDIQPGEYKYGWHALPRQFKCGSKIVSGRASCEYGIRRRSVDAYNASPSTPTSRGKSLDIPGRQQHGSSSSGSHTPGRYMPPHSAAAGRGFYSRSRATSLDSGHWGPAPHVSASLPSPQSHFGGRCRSENNSEQPPSLPSPQSHFGGRRRSENNSHNGASQQPPAIPSPQSHFGGRRRSENSSHAVPQQQQQQQHHAAKPAPTSAASAAAASAVASAMRAQAPAAAAKAAAAALAAAAAATSLPPGAAPAVVSSSKAPLAELQVSIPEATAAGRVVSPGGDVDTESQVSTEASTPMSSGADLTSPHRRKRRHRPRKNKQAGSPGAAAEGGGASSDTESQVSTSTHDSANSAPIAVVASPAAATSVAGAGAGPAGKPKAMPAAGAAAGKAEPAKGSKGAQAHSSKFAPHADKPHKPHAGSAHKQQQHPHPHGHPQQWQPKVKQADKPQQAASGGEQRRRSSNSGSGGFKRNGSCGELGALGSSPTTGGRSVLQVPTQPEGLAC